LDEILVALSSTNGLWQIELADPEKEWKLHNAWFVKQSEFFVRLRLRARAKRTG
jgi:hypothetical protein